MTTVPPDPSGQTPAPFVTSLAPVEAQVGVNVIRALQQPNTVAVVSTVAMGPDGHQRIVSVGLDAERLEQVQTLLREGNAEEDRDVPCVGFHCYIDDAPEPRA
jgi:hypothetical protein